MSSTMTPTPSSPPTGSEPTGAGQPTGSTPTGISEAKPLLALTDAAVEKVKYFARTMPDSEGKPLRIFVQGGGCSGFQYGFQFDEKREDALRNIREAIELYLEPVDDDLSGKDGAELAELVV